MDKVRHGLVQSLSKPLIEFLDILIETFIFSNELNEMISLISKLNDIRRLAGESLKYGHFINIYKMLVKFLNGIDNLDSTHLNKFKGMSEIFSMFASIFKSFKLLELIVLKLERDDMTVTKNIKDYIQLNKDVYIKLMMESTAMKEYLLVEVRMFQLNGSITNEYQKKIIKSIKFQDFLNKRKYRLRLLHTCKYQ